MFKLGALAKVTNLMLVFHCDKYTIFVKLLLKCIWGIQLAVLVQSYSEENVLNH